MKRNKSAISCAVFNLSLGNSVLALSIIVLLPFVAMVMTTADIGVAGFIKTIAEPRQGSDWTVAKNVIASDIDQFGIWYADCMGIGALRVLGKSILNALVDLPLPLPTAVMGISLATLYAPNGLIGQFLRHSALKLLLPPLVFGLALIVVSLPFIVQRCNLCLRSCRQNMKRRHRCWALVDWQLLDGSSCRSCILPCWWAQAWCLLRATGEAVRWFYCG